MAMPIRSRIFRICPNLKRRRDSCARLWRSKLIKVISSRSWNLTYGALHVAHPYYKIRVRATGVAASQSDIFSLASFTSTLRSQQEGGLVERQGCYSCLFVERNNLYCGKYADFGFRQLPCPPFPVLGLQNVSALIPPTEPSG